MATNGENGTTVKLLAGGLGLMLTITGWLISQVLTRNSDSIARIEEELRAIQSEQSEIRAAVSILSSGKMTIGGPR